MFIQFASDAAPRALGRVAIPWALADTKTVNYEREPRNEIRQSEKKPLGLGATERGPVFTLCRLDRSSWSNPPSHCFEGELQWQVAVLQTGCAGFSWPDRVTVPSTCQAGGS